MLSKDPNERFQEPAQLAEALAPWDEGPQEPAEAEMPRLSPAAARSAHSTNRLPQMTAVQPREPAISGPKNFWTGWRERLRNPRTQAALAGGIITIAAACGAAAAVVAAH
jgi:hypothetical protein